MGLNRGGFLLFAVLVAAAQLVGKGDAATYVVGDNLGWRVPPTPADYSNWATQHVLRVGDVLVFNFITGQHDVAQVRKAGYDRCSSSNPIISLSTVGPWSITINSTGDHYFICTFGSHCSLGQKLAINATTALAPAPSPTPTPVSPPTAPTPITMPAPTPTPMTMPSPSPSPTPTPMTMPAPAPTPTPGSAMSPTPSGVPSPGGLGSAPSSMTTPGDMGPPSPPPPSSALPSTMTMSGSLVVFAVAVFGLTV